MFIPTNAIVDDVQWLRGLPLDLEFYDPEDSEERQEASVAFPSYRGAAGDEGRFREFPNFIVEYA